MSPVFKHDCDKCRYLGYYRKHDLYVHEGPQWVSVIARYGSKGEEYLCTDLTLAYRADKHLAEAGRRFLEEHADDEQ